MDIDWVKTNHLLIMMICGGGYHILNGMMNGISNICQQYVKLNIVRSVERNYSMLVKDFVKQHNGETFYFIPNILSNQTFSEPQHHYGHEISNIGSIHSEILNSNVCKSWKEDKKLIIIWEKEKKN